MILRLRISEFSCFLGASIIIIAGIGFKSAAASGIGLYMLYSGRTGISQTGAGFLGLLKINFIWNLIFLVVSVMMLFSVIKGILNIFLRQDLVIANQWIILIIGLGLIYFETIFRLWGDKKNRFSVLFLMVCLILSAASFILGGHWLKSDILMGFLSLAFTVIITFRRAYFELSKILLIETHDRVPLPDTNNRDRNAK